MFPLLHRNVPHIEQKILSYLEPWKLTSAAFVSKTWYLAAKKADNGYSFLFEAIYRDLADVVAFILEDKHVNVNGQSTFGIGDGWTPLKIAAKKGNEGVLLSREDIDVNAPDHKGDTALLAAVKGGHEQIVEILLKRKDLNPNISDKRGVSPLLRATIKGCSW